MSRTQLTKIDIMAKVLKLKGEILEKMDMSHNDKEKYNVTNEYLNEILHFLDQYRY